MAYFDAGVAPRRICRLRNNQVPMRVGFLLGLTLIAAQGSLANDAADILSVALYANDHCVIDSKTTVRCDQLADRFRSHHVRSEAWIVLFIDNAKYETVAATRDSLVNNGFTHVTVTPPINGTNPPGATKRWIRLSVWGLPNHSFAMLLISTERFKTWREQLLALSPLRYEMVDRFTLARMAQPDCKSIRDSLPTPLAEYGILISEHNEDLSRSCVIPTAASCEYLSALMNQSDMHWTKAEIQPMSAVRKELPCEKLGLSDQRVGESN